MYKRKTVDCYAIESFYEGHGWSIEKMHLKIDSFPMVFYEGEGENDD